MPALTNKQKTLLGKILTEASADSARFDAFRFRASHEEDLADLDILETQGFLERKDNKYSVSLLAITEIRGQNSDAEKLLFLADLLFPILRRLYKEDPQKSVSLDNLAKCADLPLSDVRKGLSCLIQTPIWGGYSIDLSAPDASVTPSENILRYKNFDEAVETLQQWARGRQGKPEVREKQQKFGILDSPTTLSSDIAKPCGPLGRAVIYLDIDNFKAINTQLMERVVDESVLPPIHTLLANSVMHIGYAYAEGGDEFTIILPNTSERMALAYAETIRKLIENLVFEPPAKRIRVTASIGLAYGKSDEGGGKELVKFANLAKNHAKKEGKNCISIWTDGNCRVVPSETEPSNPEQIEGKSRFAGLNPYPAMTAESKEVAGSQVAIDQEEEEFKRGYEKEAFRMSPTKGAPLLRLTQLRGEGVVIRNDSAKLLFTSDLDAWTDRVSKWMKEVVEALNPVSAPDSEWFATLDVVPPARVRPPTIRLGGDADRTMFLALFNQHDYRLVRLEQLLKKHGVAA
jgi:diguanylate cyclase (GGDEF)-like protein